MTGSFHVGVQRYHERLGQPLWVDSDTAALVVVGSQPTIEGANDHRRKQVACPIALFGESFHINGRASSLRPLTAEQSFMHDVAE
jgi:hypothetical protein